MLRYTKMRALSRSLTKIPTHIPIELVKMITDGVQFDDPDKVLLVMNLVTSDPFLKAWSDATRESFYHDVYIEHSRTSKGVKLEMAVNSARHYPDTWMLVHNLVITYVYSLPTSLSSSNRNVRTVSWSMESMQDVRHRQRTQSLQTSPSSSSLVPGSPRWRSHFPVACATLDHSRHSCPHRFSQA